MAKVGEVWSDGTPAMGESDGGAEASRYPLVRT
jgi:hypothetical protein